MKKFVFPVLLLLANLAVVAQDNQEEHSATYEFGRKNAVPILVGVIVLVVLIVLWVKKRTNNGEPQTG